MIDAILDRGLRGERALVIAAVEVAIADYVEGCAEASLWIFGAADDRAALTFDHAAELLGLEATFLRQEIRARKSNEGGKTIKQGSLFAGFVEP